MQSYFLRLFFALNLFNCFSHVNCFSLNLFNLIFRDLFNCFADVWYNHFARVCNLICLIFLKGVSLYFWFFSSLTFFSCEAVLSLSTVIFAMLFKCVVLCYGYAARILDYLWQLLICSCMSQFMACISSISDLYISNNSFILLMVVPCAAHAHLKVEFHNILPHSYIWT